MELREHMQRGDFVVTDHARREMKNDGVGMDDVVTAVTTGDIIEDYPSAYPLPACLVLGRLEGGQPLHVCLSKPPLVKIITVYIPSADKWESDWKTRREQGT